MENDGRQMPLAWNRKREACQAGFPLYYYRCTALSAATGICLVRL
jgi:hypothetical protein